VRDPEASTIVTVVNFQPAEPEPIFAVVTVGIALSPTAVGSLDPVAAAASVKLALVKVAAPTGRAAVAFVAA